MIVLPEQERVRRDDGCLLMLRHAACPLRW